MNLEFVFCVQNKPTSENKFSPNDQKKNIKLSSFIYEAPTS